MVNDPKTYYLMHKNMLVAEFVLDANDIEAKPSKIKIFDRDHLPLGAQMNNIRFIEWWQDRSIPKTRQGAKSALERLGYKSVTNAMIDNLALSLNDCYWIKPSDSDLRWEDVNLFTNDFVDAFGELTFNKNNSLLLTGHIKAIALQGEVQKKWCIGPDGRRYMIKGNYGNSYQQSINEVLATQIHKSQGFDNYTPYDFVRIGLENNMTGLGCKAYSFCNEHTESISAWELLQTVKTKQNMSLYHPFKEVCLSMGMKEEDFDRFMDYEIMTDFLITNTDRHMNNISVLRDSDSLELIGFAPIYDSGNSMFYSVPTDQLSLVRLGQDKVHSFITSRENRLLKYVKDRSILDLSKIDLDFGIYDKDTDPSRRPLLEDLFYRKVEALRAFQQGKNLWEPKSVSFSVGFSKKSEPSKTEHKEEIQGEEDIEEPEL